MSLNKMIVDCTTGKTTIVPLTAQEIAERDQAAAKHAEQQTKREADAKKLADLKASAKTKLIAGKSLTDEEASAIVI
jgi:hypothetical protein